MAEGAAYCFEMTGHASGVVILVESDFKEQIKLIWENEVNDQVKRAWNESQHAAGTASACQSSLPKSRKMDHLLDKKTSFSLVEKTSLLGLREAYRDQYWTRKDPILEDRLLWRAQTFRHMVHLLPGQTILELGCGEGHFTKQLVKVTKGENPVTCISFKDRTYPLPSLPEGAEYISLEGIREQGKLVGRQFDFIISMDLLDKSNCGWFLSEIFSLLGPGGQVLCYESNPWNPVLHIRRFFGRLFGQKDPRRLLNRKKLYELISELGFIRIFAVYNDFVYAPLSKYFIWWLRNLSILLENLPRVQSLAGSILLHAQKPPRKVGRQTGTLCQHEKLFNTVSVVIPCYNEEMNLIPLLSKLKEYYGEYLYEIIPVDDNSTDNTAAILKSISKSDPLIKPIFRTPPMGVGRAISEGYKAVKGKFVLSMDCDFEHLLPELRDLFDVIANGADVAVGSRFSRHSVLLNYPFQKIVANRGFHALAKLVLNKDLRDLTNNLKLFRREVVEQLDLSQPGFAVNAQTGFHPLMMGFRVEEVPISWINRTPDMGTSSFKLIRVGRGYWVVLWDILKKKWSGYYKKNSPKLKSNDPII